MWSRPRVEVGHNSAKQHESYKRGLQKERKQKMTDSDNKFHKIESTQFEYDMAPWGCQKSGYVLEFLSRLVDRLKTAEISEEQKEELSFGLDAALYDATKVLSFFAGAKWSTEDRDLILDKGKAGFDELCKKYKV